MVIPMQSSGQAGLKKSPRRTRGNKTTKNKLWYRPGPICPGIILSVGSFPVQEGVDRTDFSIVVLVGLYLVIAVEVLYVGDCIV